MAQLLFTRDSAAYPSDDYYATLDLPLATAVDTTALASMQRRVDGTTSISGTAASSWGRPTVPATISLPCPEPLASVLYAITQATMYEFENEPLVEGHISLSQMEYAPNERTYSLYLYFHKTGHMALYSDPRLIIKLTEQFLMSGDIKQGKLPIDSEESPTRFITLY